MQSILKKKINLFDNNFAHAQGQLGFDSCGLKEPKYIEWTRNNINWQEGITVFTDYSCYENIVDKVNSKIKIAWLQESPALSPQIYVNFRHVSHKFDYVFTNIFIDNLSLKEREKIIIFPMAGSWLEPIHYTNKTKLISAIFSPKNYLPGHMLRKEVERKFKYDNKIDFFGKEHVFIENKKDGLYDYMYSITIENFKINNFFTEKLIDCLLSKTIPIYYGPDNIGEYFNKEGIIQFDSIEELKHILDNINQEVYIKKIKAVEENYIKSLEYQITDDRFIHELEKRGLI